MIDTVHEPLLTVRSSRRFGTVSPLRYPGGKASLTGFFAELIESLEIRDAVYVEPFAGGAGAALALLHDDVVAEVVINDVDPAVFCFWRSVVHHTDAFLERLEFAPLSIEEWRRQRTIYQAADERDPLGLGFAFFYLNRTNRSGVLNAGVIGGQAQDGRYTIGARFNRTELSRRVAAIGALRDRITVSDLDGGAVFRKYAPSPSTFLYIDPPYVDMGGSLYLNAFDYRDHADLARTINDAADARWVLTYDTSPLIRRLYADRSIYEFEITYSAHRPGRARELLVASNPVAEVLDGGATAA